MKSFLQANTSCRVESTWMFTFSARRTAPRPSMISIRWEIQGPYWLAQNESRLPLVFMAPVASGFRTDAITRMALRGFWTVKWNESTVKGTVLLLREMKVLLKGLCHKIFPLGLLRIFSKFAEIFAAQGALAANGKNLQSEKFELFFWTPMGSTVRVNT